MRVHELIAKLQQYDPNLEVLGQLDDSDDFYELEEQTIRCEKMFRKEERIGRESDRVSGRMTTYTLDSFKDAEVFDAVIL
jgi:hypothetical protein